VKAAFSTESCQVRGLLYLGDQDAKHEGSDDLAVVVFTGASPEQEPPPAIPGARRDGASRTEIPRYGSAVDFRDIYRSYGRGVYSLCLRMIGDKAEAEGVTREAFLQLFREIDTYHGESTFATWLYRVVLSVLLIRVIERQERYRTSPDAATRNGGSLNLHTVSPVPKRHCPNTIDRSALEKAIIKLPLDLRVVFVLHDVLGREHSEVAEILGFSPEICKLQLHKARLRLRELLCGALQENTAGEVKSRTQERERFGQIWRQFCNPVSRDAKRCERIIGTPESSKEADN
jgi:RNA polymerase sigma-70 factor, ECF subfamily